MVHAYMHGVVDILITFLMDNYLHTYIYIHVMYNYIVTIYNDLIGQYS